MTPPPLQPGQRIELTITDVAFGGDGIGRHQGFVVFVPFVDDGEVVEAEIVAVKRRYATADLCRVLAPSPHRVGPVCPYYARCAGCQYQHLAYPHQLELKRKQIVDIFQRIGKIPDPPVDPVVASPDPYGYRNKLVVHGPGRPGFWTSRGRSILAVEQCPIARPEISTRLAAISQLELENVHLALRCNTAGQVWLYTENRRGQIQPVSLDDGTGVPPVQPPAPGLRATAPSPVTETILGRPFTVPLGSFFQVNHGVIARALQHVRDRFQAGGCRVVVDAYCGVGVFALSLADLAAHVYGIEVDTRAIETATRNAQHLGLANTDFYPGKTERLLYYTQRQCPLDATCLILDPPRSGCGGLVLKTLREQQPRQILYVSCAPPVLARDIQALRTAGYRLERVTPFDMFPQTQHCEAVAELVRPS